MSESIIHFANIELGIVIVAVVGMMAIIWIACSGTKEARCVNDSTRK